MEMNLQQISEITHGSGMYVDKKGYILTNSHVAEDSELLYRDIFDLDEDDCVVIVSLAALQAVVVYSEPQIDLCLIRTLEEPNYDVPIVEFSDSVDPGQSVMALGNADIHFSVCEDIVCVEDRYTKTYSTGQYKYYHNFIDHNKKF